MEFKRISKIKKIHVSIVILFMRPINYPSHVKTVGINKRLEWILCVNILNSYIRRNLL